MQINNLNNLKINYLLTSPYYVFEIENFLSETSYKFLYDNFPTVDFNKIDLQHLKKNNFKYYFNSRTDEYSKRLKDNKTMSEINKFFFDEKFIRFILNNFYYKFFKSRSKDLKYILKLLRFKRFQHNKKRAFFDKFLFSDFFMDVEYSFMKDNAKIVPHTDSRHKMISLMLYFPDNNLTEDQISSLGTSFFDSKISNLGNKHLENENDENHFRSISKKILGLPFKKLSLFGFIRNEKSWHTVEKFNIHPDFIRKSININLYL